MSPKGASSLLHRASRVPCSRFVEDMDICSLRNNKKEKSGEKVESAMQRWNEHWLQYLTMPPSSPPPDPDVVVLVVSYKRGPPQKYRTWVPPLWLESTQRVKIVDFATAYPTFSVLRL
ncbi:uncharacterized protein LOC124293564 [Neodiprion lecontei]|uniref:Uncharacterized protein LOC124293564 n=1 Tax=Neodiprion lecontei TaxID=441921 RepID=A0ABM3FRW3_NEOLC|nr:uncharacterized protein LOC124213545 [Neodiprion pinetum]XP_046590768.1 uncharacterized protein LOC124293564 [Neodiprion lecontei]